jgi:hypothetical protein
MPGIADGAVGRDHDVGAGDQAPQCTDTLRGVEIDGHRPLAHVAAPPSQAGFRSNLVVRERWSRPMGGSGGRFDDDDLGAEFGEQPSPDGGERAADLDDPDPAQRVQITPCFVNSSNS